MAHMRFCYCYHSVKSLTHNKSDLTLSSLLLELSSYDFWPERWLDLPLFQVLPFDVPEEGVVLDRLLATVGGNTPKALIDIFLHKLKTKTKRFFLLINLRKTLFFSENNNTNNSSLRSVSDSRGHFWLMPKEHSIQFRKSPNLHGGS
jgi:hypothetical protein